MLTFCVKIKKKLYTGWFTTHISIYNNYPLSNTPCIYCGNDIKISHFYQLQTKQVFSEGNPSFQYFFFHILFVSGSVLKNSIQFKPYKITKKHILDFTDLPTPFFVTLIGVETKEFFNLSLSKRWTEESERTSSKLSVLFP